MALAKSIVKDIPLAGPIAIDAYIRVENIVVSRTSVSAIATWRQGGPDGLSFDRTNFMFAPQIGRCIFAQAYEALKALPEMSGATDC